MATLVVIERPTIELLELEIDYNPNVEGTDGDQRAQEEADQYGKYPYISYRGMNIESSNIKKLKLYNDKFVPYLEMEFEDPTGRFIDDYFPLDDAIISFFMRAPSDLLLPIRMDFKIIKFTASKTVERNENVIYSIEGELNIDGLYYRDYESYNNTSFETLKTISQELELGFVSNISETDDQMKWINPAMQKRDFIRHITEHSYKSDEAFMWSYIDFYYNLNYLDIETQMQEDISRQGIVTNNSSLVPSEGDKKTKLNLNNNPDNDQPNSNVYIKRFILENTTTQLNIELGYRHRIHYYDKNEKNYNSTYLDSISDTGDNDGIVLKGNPERINNNFSESVLSQTYMGKLDTNVVHANYLYANRQNLNNIEYLQKIKMKIVLNQPNFNLYRFQKVDVTLYKQAQVAQGDEDTKQNINPNPPAGAEKNWKINNRLSGEWLITGINYTFDKEKGNVQEITMVKRELGTQYLRN